MIAGIPVLAGGLALTAYESNKRDKFLNNPKKLEVGYVKLVNKKRKKEMIIQRNYSGEDYIKRQTLNKLRDPKNVKDAEIISEEILDEAGNVVKVTKKKLGDKILSKKVIIPATLAATAIAGGTAAYNHYKNKKEKTYSQEEEIANIPADPGTEEYSHLRAAIEKKPSQQAAGIQEGYEKTELDIKRSGREEKLEGEGKEIVNNQVRQGREENLDGRNESLDTLNNFLEGIGK